MWACATCPLTSLCGFSGRTKAKLHCDPRDLEERSGPFNPSWDCYHFCMLLYKSFSSDHLIFVLESCLSVFHVDVAFRAFRVHMGTCLICLGGVWYSYVVVSTPGECDQKLHPFNPVAGSPALPGATGHVTVSSRACRDGVVTCTAG